MYDRLTVYARDLLGGFSPELKKYVMEYKRDFRSFQEVSTKRELLSALQTAHIVVCGDYHTLSQAQRTVIRLLNESVAPLKRRNKKLILALEMARTTDNPKIRQYLRGKLSERAFLDAIQFHKNWGFPWRNYRRLFSFAREHSIEIIGINLARKATLKRRDRFAARLLAELTEADERAGILVLVGDLHLASSHLPGDLREALGRRGIERQVLVIHQNRESYYWELVEKGLDHLVEVVKVRRGEYCVLNTPPWVKLKSHVRWTEFLADGEASAPQLGKKNGAPRGPSLGDLTDVDYTDEVRELIGVIQDFIGLKGVPRDDFQLYGPSNLAFLTRLRGTGWSKVELRRLGRMLSDYQGLFIPGENILYLSTLSLNQAAAQAASYLHFKASRSNAFFREPNRDFYPVLWTEALSFLGSKIINPKRKCNGPRDLERMLATATGAKGKSRLGEVRVLKMALRHLERERALFSGKAARFSGLTLPVRVESDRQFMRLRRLATVLGHLFGQGLYAAMVGNQIGREEVAELFANPFGDARKARRLYFDYAKRLDEGQFRDFVKSEGL